MRHKLRRSRGCSRAIVAPAAGALAAAFLSSHAHAGFTTMLLQRHAIIVTPSGPKTVYRIYAQFTEGSDSVVAWGGSPQFPMTIRSVRCSNQSSLAFYQAPSGGNTAPYQEDIDADPNTMWDTFATIGVSVAQQGSGAKPDFDNTFIAGSFPTFINGNQWTSNNGAVLVQLPGTQARADYAPDGDAQLRVLLMQLTVDSSDTVAAMIGTFQWRNGAGAPPVTLNNVPVNWEPLAGFGTCCLWDGCINTFGSSCFFQGGEFMGCDACDQCTDPPCVGDAIADDVIDINDLLEVINHWGPCPPGCFFGGCDGDIHPIGGVSAIKGDCQVNINDLLVVINSWGPCP